jgi:F420H(2)-dependent quinone reductase
MDYMAITDRLWPLLRRLMKGHAVLYRASGGRLGHRFPGAPSMLLLDHVGARTGTKRTTPLSYIAEGENVVVVASKGGHPRHPAWFHNLRANPDTTIQVGSERRAVRARVANPDERARLWPKVVEAYGGYRGYQERTRREIPLVILERRAS